MLRIPYNSRFLDGPRLPFSWVPEERVPADVREFTARQVRRIGADLRITGPITVRWFGPPVGGADFYAERPTADAFPVGRTVSDDTIGLLVGLRDGQLVETIAHELLHVRNLRRGLRLDHAAVERRSHRYREQWESTRG